jgi:hypothetical protein
VHTGFAGPAQWWHDEVTALNNSGVTIHVTVTPLLFALVGLR